MDLWKWIVNHDVSRTDINGNLTSIFLDYINQKTLEASHQKAISAAAMENHDHLFSFHSEVNKRREDRVVLSRKPITLYKYMQ